MIKQRIQNILNEIKKFPQQVTLVVVTKNRNINEIEDVINAGIINIGENRIQETENKLLAISYKLKTLKKHFIGHLQSNKVKKAVEIFDMIQSVDSYELLEKIDKEARKINKIMPVLLQINIFEDQNKFGFKPTEINTEQIIELTNKYQNIQIQGLMTIAKDNLEEYKTYEGFKKLYNLYHKLNLQLKTKKHKVSPLGLTTLSMGMSNDYKIALQAGSNMIRIGSSIFEDKNTLT